MPWTADEDTKLVRAIRKMLARNGGVLPKRAAPDWKKMHRKLGIDHPANQFYIHYNWICWVHKRGLDPRHPVTHAPEIAHRELLGCDFGPQKHWPEGAPKNKVMEAARQTALKEDAWFRPSSAQSEADSESDENEDEAPPPPKRTRIKRESAPEAEETKPRIGSRVKKEAGSGEEIAKTKKRTAEAEIEAEGRPKRGRAIATAVLKPKGGMSALKKRS